MYPLPKQFPVHGTLLASVKVFLCVGRSVKRLPQHLFHTRYGTLQNLRQIKPLLSTVWIPPPSHTNGREQHKSKVNRVKMLHTMHNYLFVQHHFQHTKLVIHMNSRLPYANTKLTSPYYMNFSYTTHSNFCKGTLQNLDPIKNYHIFSPLYSKTNRPIPVPIEYLRCVEGGAIKVKHGHSFNLLYRNWVNDKLTSHQPSQEETQILNHLLAMQPHCNADLYRRVLAAFLAQDQGFQKFFRDPEMLARISNLDIERRPQTYTTIRAHCPSINSYDSLLFLPP